MSQVKKVLGRLWNEARCLYRNGKTQRRFALSRHSDLRCEYLEVVHNQYRPPAQRKLRSADSLFHFPEASLLLDEAMHSINTGDFATAHSKLDAADGVIKDDNGRRYMENFKREARDYNAQQRKLDGRRKN